MRGKRKVPESPKTKTELKQVKEEPTPLRARRAANKVKHEPQPDSDADRAMAENDQIQVPESPKTKTELKQVKEEPTPLRARRAANKVKREPQPDSDADRHMAENDQIQIIESPKKKTKLRLVKKEPTPLKERPAANKVKHEPQADSDEQQTDSDADSDMSETDQIQDRRAEFMKRQEENLRMNQEFFQKLGITEAKQEFAAVKKKKPSERGLKREKQPKEVLPRRSSLRLQNKTPLGLELPPEALIRKAFYTPYEPVQHNRPPAGPLEMVKALHGTSSEEEHGEIVRLSKKASYKWPKKEAEDLESFIGRMKNLKLKGEQVAKVVPERIFSVTIHPRTDRVLAVTGDKWGKVGLWDVQADENSKSDGVCCYAPHSRPVTWLEFPTSQPEKLYSCGYDGSLRCGDFTKEVFDEIYSVPEDDDILLRNFSFMSPHTMLVSQNDGCVAMVDIRTEGTQAEEVYDLHQRSLRTVSVHPLEQHYFCTGGVGGLLRVWDLRKVKKKGSKHVAELPHGKSINSAFFSPVTGKHILSTSMDDTLRVFDSSVIGSGIKEKKSIRHNNHTGRWLTLIRASWHPLREDMFITGSMNRPREIELYCTDGKKQHSFRNEDFLGSVCSLNAMHPTRDIVVGGNSSGRLHVFM